MFNVCACICVCMCAVASISKSILEYVAESKGIRNDINYSKYNKPSSNNKHKHKHKKTKKHSKKTQQQQQANTQPHTSIDPSMAASVSAQHGYPMYDHLYADTDTGTFTGANPSATAVNSVHTHATGHTHGGHTHHHPHTFALTQADSDTDTDEDDAISSVIDSLNENDNAHTNAHADTHSPSRFPFDMYVRTQHAQAQTPHTDLVRTTHTHANTHTNTHANTHTNTLRHQQTPHRHSLDTHGRVDESFSSSEHAYNIIQQHIDSIRTDTLVQPHTRAHTHKKPTNNIHVRSEHADILSRLDSSSFPFVRSHQHTHASTHTRGGKHHRTEASTQTPPDQRRTHTQAHAQTHTQAHTQAHRQRSRPTATTSTAVQTSIDCSLPHTSHTNSNNNPHSDVDDDSLADTHNTNRHTSTHTDTHDDADEVGVIDLNNEDDEDDYEAGHTSHTNELDVDATDTHTHADTNTNVRFSSNTHTTDSDSSVNSPYRTSQQPTSSTKHTSSRHTTSSALAQTNKHTSKKPISKHTNTHTGTHTALLQPPTRSEQDPITANYTNKKRLQHEAFQRRLQQQLPKSPPTHTQHKAAAHTRSKTHGNTQANTSVEQARMGSAHKQTPNKQIDTQTHKHPKQHSATRNPAHAPTAVANKSTNSSDNDAVMRDLLFGSQQSADSDKSSSSADTVPFTVSKQLVHTHHPAQTIETPTSSSNVTAHTPVDSHTNTNTSSSSSRSRRVKPPLPQEISSQIDDVASRIENLQACNLYACVRMYMCMCGCINDYVCTCARIFNRLYLFVDAGGRFPGQPCSKRHGHVHC
jgi:hypothetical protein